MRNPDNVYELVPNREIVRGTLQSSSNSTGDLIGMNERFNDIRTTLTNTIPKENPLTDNVEIQTNIDMLNNSIINTKIEPNNSSSAVPINYSINNTQIVLSSIFTSNSTSLVLTGNSLFIQKDSEASFDSLIQLTLTKSIIKGLIIIITSEILIENLIINETPIKNFKINANSTLSILCDVDNNNNNTFRIINTGYLDNYASNPTIINNAVETTSYELSFSAECYFPLFTATTNIAIGSDFGIFSTTDASFNIENFKSFEQDNTRKLLGLLIINDTYVYIRTILVIKNETPDYTVFFDNSTTTLIPQGTQMKFLGYSFDFNINNLLSFSVTNNLNYVYGIALVNSQTRGTNNTYFNAVNYKGTNQTISNLNQYGDFIFFEFTSEENPFATKNQTLVINVSNSKGIGELDGIYFYKKPNTERFYEVYLKSKTCFNITNNPNRLEVYFNSNFSLSLPTDKKSYFYNYNLFSNSYNGFRGFLTNKNTKNGFLNLQVTRKL